MNKTALDRVLSLLSVVPMALLFVGCADGEGIAGGGFGAPEWHAQPTARIGSLNDPAQTLTNIGQVLIGPDGELFISQPRSSEVRVYDADGAFVRVIGGRGQGPGELGQLQYTGLKGDTLYVTELGRVSLFSLTGDFLGTRTLIPELIQSADATYAPYAPQVFLALPSGEALIQPGFVVAATPPANQPGITSNQMRIPFYRTDSTAVVLDTVAWQEVSGTSLRVMNRGTLFQFAAPFDESPLLAPFPDGSGLVSVERQMGEGGQRLPSFRMTGIGIGGDTLFLEDLPYEPVAVDAAYVNRRVSQVNVIPANHPDHPGPDIIERELRSNQLIPAFQVPVRALVVGQDGSIWLQREDRDEEVATWHVFSRDGLVEGVVQLPSGLRLVAVKEDVLVAIELDQFDVPYIVRFLLERG